MTYGQAFGVAGECAAGAFVEGRGNEGLEGHFAVLDRTKDGLDCGNGLIVSARLQRFVLESLRVEFKSLVQSSSLFFLAVSYCLQETKSMPASLSLYIHNSQPPVHRASILLYERNVKLDRLVN